MPSIAATLATATVAETVTATVAATVAGTVTATVASCIHPVGRICEITYPYYPQYIVNVQSLQLSPQLLLQQKPVAVSVARVFTVFDVFVDGVCCV